jgi:hypothetical protein
MGRRGRKRDYNGRVGDVIRFVKSHPEWSYARVGEVFGVTRQAIGQLIITEERRKGIRLHVRQNKNSKPPHLTHCLACHRAIKKLQKDQAQRVEELYPGLGSKRSYHLAQLRRAGLLKNVILFFSKRRLNAYRAWRDGMPAVEIEHRYEVPNWHSTLKQLEEECPSVGRYKRRDLRPNWQKDLEGHDIKRLIRFSISGRARTKKGTKVPYQQTVHARSKRLAIRNAGITLLKMRGIEPITLRVKRWEDGDGNGRT